ncbi:hypothetical protein AX16_002502 [Volvariella volvacea WC 439]|nr:hypothetical protein AX16_002502 [Volvariella volvacea WC 439]
MLGPRRGPQLSLYGRLISQAVNGVEQQVTSPELYINSNVPFSAVICGLKGSGKIQSTSVLMENCLVKDWHLGSLPKPLSAIAFHFDSMTEGRQRKPCEAAYLSALNPSCADTATPPIVTVFVPPMCVKEAKGVYAGLPNVKIKPLYFSPKYTKNKSVTSIVSGDDSHDIPFYVEVILSIIRSITQTMKTFSYQEFCQKLAENNLLSKDRVMLELRRALLESCLEDGNEKNCVSAYFKPGHLTIIDLSSPLMDSSSVCGFFNVVLEVFLQKSLDDGKLIVLDDAHKYLGSNSGSKKLTESLLLAAEQKQQLNARILISTQDPSIVPPNFVELSSFIMAHRLPSLEWLHLSQHTSVGQKGLLPETADLQAGQAIIFAPSGLVVKPKQQSQDTRHSESTGPRVTSALAHLGRGHLRVQVRERITLDSENIHLATSKNTMKERMNYDFKPLSLVLEEARAAGRDRLGWLETLQKVRAMSPSPYKGKFRDYVEAARDAGLVDCGPPDHRCWIKLAMHVERERSSQCGDSRSSVEHQDR